jgi:ATP-binding cassette subfamily B protein
MAAEVVAARFLLTKVFVSTHPKHLGAAVPWVIVLGIVFALNAVIAVVQTEMQRLLTELVTRRSLERIVVAASSVRLAEFDDPNFHDRLQRTLVNAALRPVQMTTGLLRLGSSALSSVAVAIALATIEPLFLILILASVVPVTLASISLGRAFYRFTVEQTPTDRQRNYIQLLLTDKDIAKEIRAYGTGPFLRDRFSALYGQRLAALRRLMRTRLIRGLGSGLVSGLAVAGTLGLMVLFLSDGRVSLAGAGAAMAALILLGSQMQALAGGVGALYESSLFIEEYNAFVVAPDEDEGESHQYGGLPVEVGRVEVSDLSFTYPSRTEPSLVGVNLTIEPGQVVALVGENGSGKTTLAKLLASLYEPMSGRISWNGIDVTQLPADAVRPKVAVLFQDFVHYFMSAHENIAMGDWHGYDDRERVIAAAKRAGADSFLSAFPRGYETFLGPQFFGGSDLSGGQWQRVALARAFFRDAQLVILDEPTASLDPRAEAELFRSVKELFAGRSVVLISHRFASVRLADHIYVLDQGRVVEHGTHRTLMRDAGQYSELFTTQAAAFGLSPTTRRR